MKRYNAQISPVEYLQEKLSDHFNTEGKLLIRACHPKFWKHPRFHIDQDTYRSGIPYDLAQSMLPKFRTFAKKKRFKNGTYTVQSYTLYNLKDNPSYPDGLFAVHCRDTYNEKDMPLKKRGTIILFITSRT